MRHTRPTVLTQALATHAIVEQALGAPQSESAEQQPKMGCTDHSQMDVKHNLQSYAAHTTHRADTSAGNARDCRAGAWGAAIRVSGATTQNGLHRSQPDGRET